MWITFHVVICASVAQYIFCEVRILDRLTEVLFMMERFPSQPDQELAAVPSEILSAELTLRRVAEAHDQPIIEVVAQSDGLAPLLNMIIGSIIPIL